MPVSKVLNFVKPALGMPAMPPVPTRTTLVKFFNLDVDLGFFIFMILDPYKTLLTLSFPIFHVNIILLSMYILILCQSCFEVIMINYFFFISNVLEVGVSLNSYQNLPSVLVRCDQAP